MTPFDVVLLPFPFSDSNTTKRRPCVVLSTFKPVGLNPHAIVAMVTSKLDGNPFPADVRLRDWEQASLPLPSLVRSAKVLTVDSTLIVKTLGKLSAYDQPRLAKAFIELFNFV